jgi:intraflagellar transport protein 52
VARTVFYKYFHPKEVYVQKGVLNRELNRAAGKKPDDDQGEFSLFDPWYCDINSALTFVYPFGASLNVQKPAIPILSSGSVSYPLNRPLAGVCETGTNGGKILCLGSATIFSDAYIEKEENGKLFDVLLQYIAKDTIVLNSIDANEPDVSFY